MSGRIRVLTVTLLLGGLVPNAATAHHGWSTYDPSKTVTIETALLEVRWANPHAYLSINYQGANWAVLLAPIARMEDRGLTSAMLKPGTKVKMTGQPRSDGTKELKIQTITVAGKTFNLLPGPA
jgi:hypothetical protein